MLDQNQMTPMEDIRRPVAADSRRLLDQLRLHMRGRGLAYSTEKTYIHWIVFFIRFHKRRHPRDMGATEVDEFLSWLASSRNVSPATQAIVLNALVYLYQKFLGMPLGNLQYRRARYKRRIPQVLTHDEALAIISLHSAADAEADHRDAVRFRLATGGGAQSPHQRTWTSV